MPPKLLFCLKHWRMTPKKIQLLIWRHYRPGQEIDKRPTREYLEVQQMAVRAVEEAENSQRDVNVAFDFSNDPC